MKTKEELNALNEEELVQVVGGNVPYIVRPESNCISNIEYQRQKNEQRKSE